MRLRCVLHCCQTPPVITTANNIITAANTIITAANTVITAANTVITAANTVIAAVNTVPRWQETALEHSFFDDVKWLGLSAACLAQQLLLEQVQLAC